MKEYYNTCWLTINRNCNLECEWCYANHVKMVKILSLTNAFRIIDLCSELGIKRIILIGGEPTLHKNLFEIIKYIKQKGMQSTLISNGVLFYDEQFIKYLQDAGLEGVNLSLKGEDKESFFNITKRDQFDKVMLGIKNLKKHKMPFSVSMVLTLKNIDTFCKGLEEAKKQGAEKFNFTFCYNFDMTGDSNKEYLKNNNPYLLINKFINNYDKLNEITEGNFFLEQTFPLCIWDQDFIKKLEKRGQLASVCQLLSHKGLIFDTEMNIIPCNVMHEIKLGKFGEDFKNAIELINHLQNKKNKKIFNKLCSLPDAKCNDCDLYCNCGGGCVVQWTNYSFEEIMEWKN